MGPSWALSAPDRPHVGPTNLAIWENAEVVYVVLYMGYGDWGSTGLCLHVCVTSVHNSVMPWCMPGLLTGGFLWSRRWGETFQAFHAHAQPTILRIWQEAHWGFICIFICVLLCLGLSSHEFAALLVEYRQVSNMSAPNPNTFSYCLAAVFAESLEARC